MCFLDLGIDSATGKKKMIYQGPYTDVCVGVPRLVKIPCGKCVGCRLEYSRQWANRCMLELKDHDSAYFVTLTYNDAHLPVRYIHDPDTGEAIPHYSLVKRDFQLFLKRLRKYCPDDRIRFFMSGEYGDLNQRPHYHAILFGLHLYDLVPLRKSDQGFWYYRSALVERAWSERLVANRKKCVTPLAYDPLGYVVVANVSWQTCAYVARYVTKKLNGNLSDYEQLGIEPPFSLMSRKPGIGKKYFDDHPDLFDFDKISVSTPDGGMSFAPPAYFRRLLKQEDPDAAQLQADRGRYMSEQAQLIKSDSTTLSFTEQLAVEEDKKLNALKSLRRSDV